MNQKELKELIEFLIDKDIAEFELERGDVKVRIKRAHANLVSEVQNVAAAHPAPAAAPSVVTAHPAPASPTAAGTAAADIAEQPGMHTIRSPIVGTFYEAPSPGAPPFVKPGDTVTVGQVLCIIEAMKLMNEIESDYAGEVVKRHVSNAQPVEYGQPLFTIRAQ
jgi:acetyl-CoA carboxylase biotin carboxyl carrier protein